MVDSIGVELPSRTKPARVGNRWLSVIPIAQAAVINDEVLVQLIALERRDSGAILTVRISRVEEMILTEPRDDIPWPFLDVAAQDDRGTDYRIEGGAGSGSQSDWQVEFGLTGPTLAVAQRLDITITELRWEDMASGTVVSRNPGNWAFTIDLTRELPARMV